jgi:predicted protein tyrosine phosphatase
LSIFQKFNLADFSKSFNLVDFFLFQVFEDAVEAVEGEEAGGEVEGEIPLGQGLQEAQIAIGKNRAHRRNLKKKF